LPWGRTASTSIFSPGFFAASAAARSSWVLRGLPSRLVRRSPAARPMTAAGLFGSTRRMARPLASKAVAAWSMAMPKYALAAGWVAGGVAGGVTGGASPAASRPQAVRRSRARMEAFRR